MIWLVSRNRSTTVLALILIWAGLIRGCRCDASPPGLQSDEASNAWNAWCLVHTGRDEWGRHWPVFYTRAFDDYRSPLYVYALIPFQAIGAMSVCTTRLPAVVGGVVAIALVYFIARQLFDRAVGLVAAAAVALMPWHIQHTRWGHEGSITPFLFAGAFAALMWSGMPLCDSPPRPRIGRSILAGAVAGLALYGYAAMRMVLPATLLLGAIAAAPALRRAGHDSAGRRALLGALAALAIVVAPLAWKHLSDPLINTRAREARVWTDDDPVAIRMKNVAARYITHFGPSFLFVRGSINPTFSFPEGYGSLHSYMLPLLLIGIAVALWRARSSISARMLLVMLACYPLGDVLFGWSDDPHPLRSFAGVVPLGITIALGTSAAARWLAARSLQLAYAFVGFLVLVTVSSHVLFLTRFFGQFNDYAVTIWVRNADLVEACMWLRPRFEQFDAVFCTQDRIVYPYAVTLAALGYDPEAWFAGEREYAPAPPPYDAHRVCTAFGKMRFLYDLERARHELDRLAADPASTRVAMILRPQEAWLAGGRPPVHAIRRAGRIWLYIYEFEI